MTDPGIPAFSGDEPGPTTPLLDTDTPLSLVFRFFPEELLEHIAVETNRYATIKMQRIADNKWRPVTAHDIRTYLGIRVYMSVISLPTYDMYWSGDYMFGNMFIPKVMVRDRFDKIQQYFHVGNSFTNPRRGEPGHDRLAHVRHILDIVRRNCYLGYTPHKECAVDEAMIAFRGRLSFKQYMPAKPTRYGIKVWCRADSANGFMNDFQIYTGKEQQAEVGLTTRVVLDLTTDIAGKHHVVNMDNYFTSPDLFERLHEMDILARGTARVNRRGYPKGLLKDQDVKERGQYVACQKQEMTAVKWRDKKIVNFLSTAESALQIGEVDRKKKDGTVQKVPCPEIVMHYNAYMNGVDHADQIRTQIGTYRTSRKWWQYVFWFLFDVSISNGFILMKESQLHIHRTRQGNVKPHTMLGFRKDLAKELIGETRASRKRFRQDHADPQAPVQFHSPCVSKKGRCKYGVDHKLKRHETRMCCKSCKVSLCIEHFGLYHGWS